MYLRRQQEMGLMQKTRCLMDENDVSFHMSFITIASKSRISVFKQCQSNSQISVSFVVVFLGGGGGGVVGGACTEAKISSRFFSEKRVHKALRSA